MLLIDEPFGSLDEITARKLRGDLLGIWKDKGRTIIFDTHDIHEAVFLSDRIGILSSKPVNFTDIFQVEITQPRSSEGGEFLEYENLIIKTLSIPNAA